MRWIDVDERGRLTRLGDVLAQPGPGLFRMVVQKGECWENAVLPQEQMYTITREEGRITLQVDRVRAEDQDFDISLTLVVEETDGEIRFTGRVENRDDALVTDLYYPSLGLIESLGCGAPELLWPLQAGCRFPDIGAQLARKNGRDLEHQMALQYPGAHCDGGSMGYLMLRDAENYLYLGNHDEQFHAATLRVFGDPEGRGLVGAEIGRMAFVRGGETWEIPTAVCLMGKGTWHAGARRYRAWADGWFDKRTPPDWVRKMNGYFLVINKQQYRKSCWPYHTLGQLYDHAVAHGLDVLGLFGWYETGHDNGYPDLWPAQDLGGEEALRQGLADVHRKGGHATLYYQGNLIDTGSEFYRQHKEEAEGKSRWGQPYIQSFDKAQSSDFLRFFSGKWFSTACPGQPIWRECMRQKAQLAHGYGADGVLYDQIGGMGAYPCFNEAHGHERPSTSYVSGRKLLLSEIRAQAEKNGPAFAFFSEHITDVYAQYLDCLHGMMTNPGTEHGGDRRQFPELFRYTFPECMMTVRNGQPFMPRRLVNYALAYGMRFEMEIRYLTDKQFLLEDRAGELREYSHAMAALRRRHEDALLLGRYLDDEGVEAVPGLTVKRFRGEKEEALVLWNDTEGPLPLRVSIPGMRLTCLDGVEGPLTETGEIAPQTVVVARLERA